jgi:hypothetical protein
LEINLRISEKVHLLIEESLAKDSDEKFYKHLKNTSIDPDNEEQTVNLV